MKYKTPKSFALKDINEIVLPQEKEIAEYLKEHHGESFNDDDWFINAKYLSSKEHTKLNMQLKLLGVNMGKHNMDRFNKT